MFISNLSSLRLTAAMLGLCLCFSTGVANANSQAKVFPPDNSQYCTTSNIGILGWDGINNVTCNSIQNLLNQLHCAAGQYIAFNGVTPYCANGPTACQPNEVLTYTNGSFQCVSSNSSVPSNCGQGQVLTYTNNSFACVAQTNNQNLTLPTCGAGQYMTSNGSQLVCATLPASGGGTGNWCGLFWNLLNNHSGTQSWGGTPCGTTPVISGSCSMPEANTPCTGGVPNASECPGGYTFYSLGGTYFTCIQN